jgi:S-adenosylmethionine:tRNA ribosyltransferase-isomerase
VEVWRALVAGKNLRPGTELLLSDLRAVFLGRDADGTARVELTTPRGVLEELARLGELPLPPYIRREHGATAADAERYQTVYARVPGAVAAPTAGLHFTDEILAALRARGCTVASITLHVGPGTFAPVRVEDPSQHVMHLERFEIPAETAAAHAAARAAGRPVVAVGTTVVRALESAARPEGGLAAGPGATRLFIRPGTALSTFDLLVTNFHLPRSTLLMLVAAVCGLERMRAAYACAVAEGYRFFSYGDAMLVVRP